MPAGTWNTVIEQGADWSRTLTWKDANGTAINLTGYTAKMQIRLAADSAAAIMTLRTTPGAGEGTITLGGALGMVALSLTAALTEAMSFAGGETGSVTEAGEVVEGLLGVHDLELTSPGGVVTRLVAGIVCFAPEVTK